MTPRDRVTNAVFHRNAIPIPTLLTIPTDVYSLRREECDELRHRFASDLDFLDYRYSLKQASPKNDTLFTDTWGCFWQKNACGEFLPETDAAPLTDPCDLDSVVLPESPVTGQMQEDVTGACDRNARFVVVQTAIRPFRRLQALLGRELAVETIHRDSPYLRRFLKRLHGYYLRQLEAWCATDVDAVCLGDDWADDVGLPFPAGMWSELFLPMLAEYCEILQENDKFAYFSSSGNIHQLIPQLVVAGVDVVRCYSGAIREESLAAQHGGKMAFHVVLDGKLTAAGEVSEISERILAIRQALETSCGIIAECRMTADTPMRNISGAMLNFRRRMPTEG